MVPFVRTKLDMSILLGCAIIISHSAYSFIKLPLFFLLTTVLLNLGGKFEK